MKISPKENIYARFWVPSDQAITHRALLLGGIAKGKTYVVNPSANDETYAAISCLKKIGAKVKAKRGLIEIKPTKRIETGLKIDCGKSETVMRFLCGLAAGSGVRVELTGDKWLCQRPMRNVKEPLEAMGATVALRNYSVPPVLVEGSGVRAIDYVMDVGSSQVKSSVLLCALSGKTRATITEKSPSRNHMEILLKEMGADVSFENDGKTVSLRESEIKGKRIYVCGDFTQAAYYIVLGLILGKVECKNVGVNPTRTRALEIMRRMGAKIKIVNRRILCGEPIADVIAEKSKINATLVTGEEAYAALSELPAIAVLAGLAEGETIIAESAAAKGYDPLLFDSITELICSIGGRCRRFDGGIVVNGVEKYEGGAVKTQGSGKIGMAAAVALTASKEGGEIDDETSINGEYPDFLEILMGRSFAYLTRKAEDSAAKINAFVLGEIDSKSFCFSTKTVGRTGLKKALAELKDCDGYSADDEFVSNMSKKVIKYHGATRATKTINVAMGVAGWQTDGTAALYALKSLGVNPSGKTILVAGLENAGKNVALCLKDAKAKTEVYDANPKSVADFNRKASDEVKAVNEILDDAKYEVVIKTSNESDLSDVENIALKNAEYVVDFAESDASEFSETARRLGKKAAGGKETRFYKTYLADCIFAEREPSFEEANKLFEKYQRAEIAAK